MCKEQLYGCVKLKHYSAYIVRLCMNIHVAVPVFIILYVLYILGTLQPYIACDSVHVELAMLTTQITSTRSVFKLIEVWFAHARRSL